MTVKAGMNRSKPVIALKIFKNVTTRSFKLEQVVMLDNDMQQ